MKRKKKFCLGAGVLTVLVIAVLAVAGGGQEVETVQASQGNIVCTVTDSGYVQPATNYDIHATQSARVVQVPVETGQPVHQGQTLVLLENLDLAAQISEARSQLSQSQTTADGARAAMERIQLELNDAKQNLDRMQELFQAGAVAKTDYDKAKLQVETTQQSLNEQQSLLDTALAQADGLNQLLQQYGAKEQQLVVKSPVGGMVLNLPVKQEQVITAGTLLVSVAIPEQLEIKADILSDDLADVKMGQKVTVTAPVLGQKVLTGEVKQIYPRAEEKQSALGILQRRVPVIVTLQDQANLKSGYEVKVAIETLSRQDILTLPREAVRTTGDGQKEVMVVINKKVYHRPVQTGISDQNNIEITGGLSAGDEVVKDGSLALKEKSKVKPAVKKS
ncbi:efflux RND transporter periplasmic adaptor subunit [Pelotomaculum sp. PtaB.Bin117]|uniref:efflux RND transporter periplasmic adaptor subunit n=1 Tax=Pelotomaculum sp. PtaB.Bin117 TaxID=1811694 RepID=UPI0009D6207C|nr:efflux RND transporter periplasmic adaptor subunit [Pelotomaculum sp. PtaB.Bin117]OPX86892.1 MAG: Macrolide export protein MacA [Pelotomaculum sp. PtaB.Bin117]OPY61808.1 MAG: Macrolide export protein MacA [Pelotomaculum sp. PtaU1.Bin065]